MAQRGRPKKEKVSEPVSNGDGVLPQSDNQLLNVSTQVIVGLLLGSSGNYGNMMSKKAVIIAKELIAEVEKG